MQIGGNPAGGRQTGFESFSALEDQLADSLQEDGRIWPSREQQDTLIDNVARRGLFDVIRDLHAQTQARRASRRSLAQARSSLSRTLGQLIVGRTPLYKLHNLLDTFSGTPRLYGSFLRAGQFIQIFPHATNRQIQDLVRASTVIQRHGRSLGTEIRRILRRTIRPGLVRRAKRAKRVSRILRRLITRL